MHQDDPALEQRLSRFEAQLDRFSLALHQWHAKERSSSPQTADIDHRIKSIEDTLDREAHGFGPPLRHLAELPDRESSRERRWEVG